MKTAILCILAFLLYFVTAQRQNSNDDAKYSQHALNDEANSRYFRALPKYLRDDGESDKAAPTAVNNEEIIYDKALLKKVVKKLRDYINQIIEAYNLDVIKTEEKVSKSHKESNSNDKNHHSSATKAEEEKTEDEQKPRHKNVTEESPTELEKEDVQDEDMSDKCANYEKHHHKDKTHSKADPSKDDDAEFDDSYSERFLRNIPFDR